MQFLNRFLGTSPLLARVAPFVVFLVLTSCQGQFGAASAYWFYLAKTLVAVWLIWEMRPLVSEMRWAISWEAVVVGIGVFVLWVGLDPFYPKLTEIITKLGLSKFFGTHQAIWNPHEQFGQNSALAWLMIVTRILGSTLVVPPLEEVFYRSFLYRYVAKPGFPFRAAEPVFTAAVFGDRRRLWLFPQPMAGGHFVRRGVSMAGAAQESPGRRDDGARHHQFPAGRVDRVAGRVAVLVNSGS